MPSADGIPNRPPDMTDTVLRISFRRWPGPDKLLATWGLPSSSSASVTSAEPAGPSGSVDQTESLLATIGRARTNEPTKSRTPGALTSAPNVPPGPAPCALAGAVEDKVVRLAARGRGGAGVAPSPGLAAAFARASSL